MMTLEDQRVVTLGELGNFLGDRKRAWGPGGGGRRCGRGEVGQGGMASEIMFFCLSFSFWATLRHVDLLARDQIQAAVLT